MYNNSYYGNYRQITFEDCWSTADKFLAEYKDSGLYTTQNKITDSNAKILYYLLYSKFGGSVIASSNTNQFKYQVWCTIFEFGPTWEKRLDIQDKLRKLTEDELLSGGLMIYNHANNPSTAPSTTDKSELDYIDDQNTARRIQGKLQGYSLLNELLKTDVTASFLQKFSKFFITIVLPEKPLWYKTEEEPEE